MILTEYFEISGIFQRFLFSREGFSDSFPTIFRQLSNKKSKSDAAVPGRARTYVHQGYNLLLYHCATLTLCYRNFVSTILSIVSLSLTLSAMC
jgi:hypothetical protein